MSALATLMCALMTLGCQGEPQCVPGRSVACACVGGGEGAQTCAPSGRQYLACVCPDSAPQLNAEVSEVLPVSARQDAPPLVEVSPTPQPSLGSLSSLERPASLSAKVMKGDDPLDDPPLRLVSASAPSVDSAPSNSAPSNNAPSNSAPPEQASASPRERDDSSIELEPIEIPRASTAGASQVKREWWLVLEGAQRCEPSDDINAPTHPAQLLAQGCYIKLKRDQRMRIKCDGPPHGPQSFQYTETKARCLELMKPTPREPSDDASSSSRASRASRASRPSSSSRARSASQGGRGAQWHCLCYQEVFQGVASDSTACRTSMESCRDLEQKIEEGSPLLVKGSTSVRCKTYQAEEPWDLFGVRYQWLPSSQPGAWWSPRGCFLDPRAQRRRARAQRKRPAQATRRATSRAPQERPSPPVAQVSKAPDEPTTGRSCEQACWANLAEPSERAQRFKQRDVPTTLLWGAPYAKRVGAIMETCVTRNRSQGRSNYRRGCFQGSLKACTKICERDQ